MSQQQQSIASKMASSVERARHEVNSFKAHVARMLRSESPTEVASARKLGEHMSQAEAFVEKAESTVKRIRQGGRVPPRPTASVPPSERAKRSLAVLRAGLDADGYATTDKSGETRPDGNNRNKKLRIASNSQFPFLSAAGKPVATPVLEDTFNDMLQELTKETTLNVGRMGTRGVGFECKHVFRAFVWFKEADPPSESKPTAPDSPQPSYIVPEHIGCFGIDETTASRWSSSRYAVFKVFTERANAAVRYFMAREKSGEEAFRALARWLERHKTLFSAKCEGRRLAFDASRGIFLPACIYPFEGNGAPRFTRGSIPLRSNSTQPAVRVQAQGHANAQAQTSAHAHGQVQQHVGHRSGVPTAPTSGQGTTNGMPGALGRGMVPAPHPVAPNANMQGAGIPTVKREVRPRQRPHAAMQRK